MADKPCNPCQSTARQMNRQGCIGSLINIRSNAQQIRANANKRYEWLGSKWLCWFPVGIAGVLIGVFSDPVFAIVDRLTKGKGK